MRNPIKISLAVVAAIGLTACQRSGEAEVDRALRGLNVVDETNLNEVMLTIGDPEEAVSYFARANANDPGRIDLMRGLAKSLVRAARPTEAVIAWREVTAHPEATAEDGVGYADALIRNNRWDDAQVALNAVPPTYETFARYRLEAMVADSNEDWARADSYYETAVGLTTTPAKVLNNWGYSKLTRGAYGDAERLFIDALRHEPGLYTAKNNLVLARGAQRNYYLPSVTMTQVERAQLLHTLALSAIKQNDVTIGKSLLREAIDTHPQYFEEAVRALRALEGTTTNLNAVAL